MKLLKALFLSLAVSGFVSFLVVGTLFTRIEGTQLNEEAFLLDSKPTVIYDGEEKVLAKFFKDRRSIAMYDEIPVEIIDAITATEDRKFFEHAGINVRSISRAAVRIVQNGDLVEGGSTITQQLIKRTHLTAEKTLERKQQEAIYATILEKNFTKEEILELYLNGVEYKYHAFGVRDAMMTYFGHTFEQFKNLPREERIIKASLLAGMVQNPSRIDPFQNPERALTRRDLVIDNLKAAKKITEEEYQKTTGKPLMVLKAPMREFPEEKFENFELVHYALYEASKTLNKPIKDIMGGSYDIYTSFDVGVYNIMREEFEQKKFFPRNASNGTKADSAAVYLNPKKGEIIAFTGSRDEITENEFLGFNNAFMMTRQPGSTIKPIIAYGPALESGKFGRYSRLADDKGHVFPGGYVVKDWDAGGRGTVSMEEAIRQSWNIPAVWTLQQVGVNYSVNYAKRLGIDFSKEKSGLSMALGGVDKGVSPLEMADSYQAFANNGVRTPAHAIRKIEDSNKNIVFETQIIKEPVIKPANAKTMKEMLQIGVSRGTSKRAQISGHNIAGKTGTTQHPFVKGANKDVWFVGFDDNNILGAIWMGFENSKYALHEGSKLPATMYSDMTEKIIKYLEKKNPNKKPDPIEIALTDGLKGTVDNETGNVALSWENFDDNVLYNLYKNGVLLEQVDDLSFTDEGLNNGEYEYNIVIVSKINHAILAKTNTIKLQVEIIEPVVEEPVVEEAIVEEVEELEEQEPIEVAPEKHVQEVSVQAPTPETPVQVPPSSPKPQNGVKIPETGQSSLEQRIEEALKEADSQ